VEGDPSAPVQLGRTPRQSFMVRFDRQTGQVRRDAREALFVDARPSALNRDQLLSQYGLAATSRVDPGAGLRLDWAESVSAWAQRVLTTGDLDQRNGPYQMDDERLRRALIGNESLDTVLLQDVARIALYDERDLAQAMGARELSRRRGTAQTDSLYAAYPENERIGIDFQGLFEAGSAFDASPAGLRRLRDSIDRWIGGDTNRNSDGTVGNGTLFEDEDEPLAQRFIVDAFSGELIEVTR